MQAAFLIFIGGGLSSVLRWVTGLFALRVFGPGFPAGTLAAVALGLGLGGFWARG